MTLASPLTLLEEWTRRTGGARLRDLLLLGHDVDLAFLERTAVPAARALGARVTVIGDAAGASSEAVDVRLAGRDYLHALAAVPGLFHARLALLVGDGEAVAALGSGDPTPAGWNGADELWTVLRGGAALGDIGMWLLQLTETIALPGHAATVLEDIAASLPTADPDGGDGHVAVRVLHNLDEGLLARLPAGPVDELVLYAPVLDPSGETLDGVLDRFSPARTVLGLQPELGAYEGDAIVLAAGDRPLEVRLLPEERPRHGRLLEWAVDGRRHALVGGSELTAAALTSTAAEGNCELVVLAPVNASLLPAGTSFPLAELEGRRRERPAARPARSAIGALVTESGLRVTLAAAYDTSVPVRVSPDGAPASWTALGTVTARERVKVFDADVRPGSAVQTGADSAPVFAAATSTGAFETGYDEAAILADPFVAARFRGDYLDDPGGCAERLANAAPEPHWGLAPAPGTVEIPDPDAWRAWVPEAAATPLLGRLLVLLLGHGVWAPDDPSWRPELARVIAALAGDPAQHVLTAVCVGLLRGGGPADDALAERAWDLARGAVAAADPDGAGDLLIASAAPRARVLTRAALGELHDEAGVSDPLVSATAELAGTGWDLELDDGLYTVSGTFTNPVPVAARVATMLGEEQDTVLVRAVGTDRRWAFIAWRRPDLLLASHPAGSAWRLYRLSGGATPESRLAGGDGLNRIGLVGNPVRLGQAPPPAAQRLLTEAGTDHLTLLRRLTSDDRR
ncbi:hypothetical protein [Actinomadura parmotrematis]|uniref:Uncharacterized protein n=1 Tax=Actinomadura parmotrematis TaxID=2864039 RepID=A0ABS7G4A5_9ACTN|nr:hypothetical protein [Actinomadura parmotrematis]MBW8486627.1 hypothetical protein [Actinomadura parmotrematis]